MAMTTVFLGKTWAHNLLNGSIARQVDKRGTHVGLLPKNCRRLFSHTFRPRSLCFRGAI